MPQMRIEIKVQPGARKNEILGFQGDVVRLRVTAPPDRGRANEAAIELLAEALDIPKSRVTLVRGAASRDKLLAIEGLDMAEIKRRLGKAD